MGASWRKGILVVSISLVFIVALAACAPRVESASTNSSDNAVASSQEGASVQQVSADTAGECAACHSKEAESMADTALLASAHAANDCASCHTQEAIGEIHASVTAPPTEDQQKALRKKGRTMGTSEFCLQCHGSLEGLAEKTAECTMVQDTVGTIVNPHALPTGAKHVEAGVQECYNCHWLHQKSSSPNANCNTCHHQAVYQCGTCHEIRD